MAPLSKYSDPSLSDPELLSCSGDTPGSLQCSSLSAPGTLRAVQGAKNGEKSDWKQKGQVSSAENIYNSGKTCADSSTPPGYIQAHLYNCI